MITVTVLSHQNSRWIRVFLHIVAFAIVPLLNLLNWGEVSFAAHLQAGLFLSFQHILSYDLINQNHLRFSSSKKSFWSFFKRRKGIHGHICLRSQRWLISQWDLSESEALLSSHASFVFVSDHWPVRGGGDYWPASGLLQGPDQSGRW